MLKIKTITHKNWKRILKKESSFKNIKIDGFDGEIALLHFLEVEAPLTKQYKNKNFTIVDNNYYWLQMGPKNENYWITAMLDDKKKLIQFYIDITKENIIQGNGNSYFYDLFLDVVILPDGEVYFLDEDELSQALNLGEITKADFDMAYSVAEKISASVKPDLKRLIDFSNYCLSIL